MPSLNVKAAGTYYTAKRVWVKVLGAWTNGKEVWAKSGGIWRRVWQYFTATLNSGSYSNSAFWFGGPARTVSITATVLVSGGEAPLTYLWTFTGTPSSYFGHLSPSLTLNLTASGAADASGTLKCQVTDASSTVIETLESTWSLAINT